MTGNVALPTVARPGVSRTLRAGEWLNEHARTIALVAVAVSVMIAGGYALFLGTELRYFDEQVYVQLTQSLAHNHVFSLDGGVQSTAYRPPGYAFILLPVYLVSGGSVLAMRMIGVAALAGSVWFTYLIGRRVHSPATGAVAAAVVACYPLMIYTATALYPQVPALFLLLVMAETGMRALPADGATGRHRLLMAVVAGLSGGLLTLAVPTFAPTVILLVLWLVWRQWRTTRRIAWRAVAVLIVAVAVLPLGWTARNAAVLHAFVPVSTNDGVNLLLGNSPHATPGAGRNTDISSYENVAKQRQLSEVELDRYYTREGLAWIHAHPGHATTLFAEKFVDNFSYQNDLVTTGQSSAAQDVVSALSYYPILALALLRIALYRRFPLHPVEKMVIGTILVNVLVLSVFYTRIRFRVPLDALTIVLAASTVTHFLLRRDEQRAD